jgi:hypothetical protein
MVARSVRSVFYELLRQLRCSPELITDGAGIEMNPSPLRTSLQRPGQGPRSEDPLSPSLSAVILWFAWVVEVEPRPEGVGAPPPFADGIGLVLVLIFALGDLVIGDLIFAGFVAGVLSLLIVPDELPKDLNLPLAVVLCSCSVYSIPAVLNAGAIRLSLRLSACGPLGQA